jgi:hypothetical protein
MKKSTIIKTAIILGIIVLVILGLHLIGNSIFPMIKNHMGM